MKPIIIFIIKSLVVLILFLIIHRKRFDNGIFFQSSKIIFIIMSGIIVLLTLFNLFVKKMTPAESLTQFCFIDFLLLTLLSTLFAKIWIKPGEQKDKN